MSGDAAWDYAVGLYGRPGVAGACLALQDRRGADVLAILALLHRATLGGTVEQGALARALARVADWRRAAILPLRQVRRALKGWRFDDAGRRAADPEQARQAVAAAERAAERVALDVLAAALADSVVDDTAIAPQRAASMLAAYWRAAGLDCDGADRAALEAILAAAFPGAAEGALERAFKTRPEA